MKSYLDVGILRYPGLGIPLSPEPYHLDRIAYPFPVSLRGMQLVFYGLVSPALLNVRSHKSHNFLLRV